MCSKLWQIYWLKFSTKQKQERTQTYRKYKEEHRLCDVCTIASISSHDHEFWMVFVGILAEIFLPQTRIPLKTAPAYAVWNLKFKKFQYQTQLWRGEEWNTHGK